MSPQFSHLASLPRRLRVPAESITNGHLREGLEALTKVHDEQHWLDRIVMAVVLLNVKGPSHAESVLTRAVHERELPSNLRTMAFSGLGTAFIYRNRFGDAVQAFERAVHYARKAHDIYQLCDAQISLIGAKVDCFGPSALGTLVTEALRSAHTIGDPHMLALLHYRVAVVEGRRGAMDLARRHIDLGLELLRRTPNPWIECCVRLTASSLAFVSSDHIGALEESECALRLSRLCGTAFYELASLCNVAQICVVLGHTDRASSHLRTAEPSISEFPFLRFCMYDTQAQLQLASGDLSGCHETLDALSRQMAQTTGDEQSFPQLDSLITRIKLLRKEGCVDEATTLAKEAVSLATTRGERILESSFRILLSDLLLDAGQLEEASRVFGEAERACPTALESLSARAELDHVRGRILDATGSSHDAVRPMRRSARFYDLVGDTAARDTTLLSMKQAMSSLGLSEAETLPQDHPTNARETESQEKGLGFLESLASLSTLGSHPGLLGSEALDILSEAGVAERLALVGGKSGDLRLIRENNWPDAADNHRQQEAVAIPLGTTGGLDYELLVLPHQTFQAKSSISSVAKLIQLAVGNEQHRREKLQNGSVWPADYNVEQVDGVFGSPCMRNVLGQAMKVAKTSLTILLTGETGVGKEVLARQIHRLSPRSGRVFQPVVCAGMSSGLLESQLFGHKKGSFTSAFADFPGVIRGAEGGTLFLDEIGEIAGDLQVKLLRFLELKEIHPLGEVHPLKVDVRVITATNANIHQLVEDGKFREDLFYRLSIATFNIPPLRQRREEIPTLIQYFLAQYSHQNQTSTPKISDEALEYLILYGWPGNVRELRNEMERLAGIMDPDACVTPADLKPEITSSRKTKPIISLPYEITVRVDQRLHEATDQLEREMIRRVLSSHPRNLEAAARALGLTRKGLYHKRQRLGML